MDIARHGKTVGPGFSLLLFLLGLIVAGCAGSDEKAEKEKSAYTPPRWNNLVHERFYDPEARAAHEEILAKTPRDPTLLWQEEFTFSRRLQEKSRASMADAVRAAALSMKQPGWAESDEELAELVKELVERSIVKSSWQIDDKTPLTKGKIAYMICQACGLRGGLWMNLFGPSERYCLKEAMYHDIIRTGSLHIFVSGPELLDILAQADCFKMDKPELVCPR